jgi:protocatechuate 3,4-dioxygenase beta subunit
MEILASIDFIALASLLRGRQTTDAPGQSAFVTMRW